MECGAEGRCTDEKILSFFSQIDALQDIGGSLAMKLSDLKNPL